MPFDGRNRQPPWLLPAGRFALDTTHPLSAGLLGYWPLNGDAKDYSGTGHLGARVGTPATAVGALGPCLSLNGTTDYVIVGNNFVFTSATYSVWVKLLSLVPAYTCVMGYSDGSNSDLELFVKSSGKLACYKAIPGGSASYDGTGSHTLSTGVWYHLAMTYGPAAGITGYVNGSLDGAAAYNQVVTPSTLMLAIGQDLGTAGRLVTGQVANVMLFGRELSAREVMRLYAEPYALLRPVTSRSLPARMVAGGAPSTQTRAIVLA